MNLQQLVRQARRAASPIAFIKDIGRWFLRFAWLEAGDGIAITRNPESVRVEVDAEYLDANDSDREVAVTDGEPAGHLADVVANIVSPAAFDATGDLAVTGELEGAEGERQLRLYIDLSTVSGYVADGCQQLIHRAGILSWDDACCGCAEPTPTPTATCTCSTVPTVCVQLSADLTIASCCNTAAASHTFSGPFELSLRAGGCSEWNYSSELAGGDYECVRLLHLEASSQWVLDFWLATSPGPTSYGSYCRLRFVWASSACEPFAGTFAYSAYISSPGSCGSSNGSGKTALVAEGACAMPTPTPTPTSGCANRIQDAFGRTEDPIASGWTADTDNGEQIECDGSRAILQGNLAHTYARYTGQDLCGDDVTVEADVSKDNTNWSQNICYHIVTAGDDSGANRYEGFLQTGDSNYYHRIYKCVGGSRTIISASLISAITPSHIKLTCDGNSIECEVTHSGGTRSETATDSDVSTRTTPGIGLEWWDRGDAGTWVGLDNFDANTI